MRTLRVYVAGKLNDSDAVKYLRNCHRMILVAESVRRQGFSVYIPCLDFLMGMVFGDWSYEDYFDNSQPWLEVSDAVVVCPDGWEDSDGTKKEIATAERLDIPVFFSTEDLVKWRDEKNGTSDV